MKRLLVVLIASAIGGCQCWDDAYQAYCADSGNCTVDGGSGAGDGGAGDGGAGDGGTSDSGTGDAGTADGGAGDDAGAAQSDGGASTWKLSLEIPDAPVGTCVEGTLLVVNGSGAPVPLDGKTPVRLSSPNGGSFFLGADCLDGPRNEFELTNGTAGRISFTAARFGTMRLSAVTDAGYGEALVDVNATATLSLLLASQPTDMTCTSGSRVAFQVIARGATGAVSTDQLVSIKLESSLPEVRVSDVLGSCSSSVANSTFPTGGTSAMNVWVGSDAGLPSGGEYSVTLSLPGAEPFVELLDGGDTLLLGIGCTPQGGSCSSSGECCNAVACTAGICR